MKNDDLFEAIETERSRLRCVRVEDAGIIAGLMTPAVSRWLASWPAPVTEEVVATRIAEARAEVVTNQALHCLVERRSDSAVMGWIRVSRIEASPERGELGFWLSEANHGHGFHGSSEGSWV